MTITKGTGPATQQAAEGAGVRAMKSRVMLVSGAGVLFLLAGGAYLRGFSHPDDREDTEKPQRRVDRKEPERTKAVAEPDLAVVAVPKPNLAASVIRTDATPLPPLSSVDLSQREIEVVSKFKSIDELVRAAHEAERAFLESTDDNRAANQAKLLELTNLVARLTPRPSPTPVDESTAECQRKYLTALSTAAGNPTGESSERLKERLCSGAGTNPMITERSK